MKKFLSLVVVLLLTGCGTMGGMVTATMSDADFVSAAPEQRDAYLKNIQEEALVLSTKKEVEYQAGRPVYYGDSKTGYTLQWNRRLGLVSVYPGHITGPMGMESAALLVLRADERGNIHYQQAGGVDKPTTILANVANQEALGRLFVKGGFQVLGAAANGAIAAKIHSDASCGENCGNIVMVNQGGNAGASAGAQAGANVDANIALGACPSGNCGVPMD
jgi:hypothetical protein